MDRCTQQPNGYQMMDRKMTQHHDAQTNGDIKMFDRQSTHSQMVIKCWTDRQTCGQMQKPNGY